MDATNPQQFDLGQNIFNTLNTGVSGYFNYLSAKEISKNAQKAVPAINSTFLILGIVAVAVVYITTRK